MFLSMSKCNGQTALEYNATRNSYILTMVPEVLVFILSKRKNRKILFLIIQQKLLMRQTIMANYPIKRFSDSEIICCVWLDDSLVIQVSIDFRDFSFPQLVHGFRFVFTKVVDLRINTMIMISVLDLSIHFGNNN